MRRRLLTYVILLLLGAATGLARAEVPQGSGERGGDRSLYGPGSGHGQYGMRGMRGRCGKRRGDCYGARRPVTGADDARSQIVRYYEGQDVTIAKLVEKQWQYEADILDRQGVPIDRVMIDKRSGRIRSLF